MFNTSAKLRSLNRDKPKVNTSKSQATIANSSGIKVNSLKNTIKNNTTNSIYVENIESLNGKIANINKGFTSAISEKMTNYNNLKNEVLEKINSERARLGREEEKWKQEQKKK